MFQGSIPADTQRIVYDAIKRWQPPSLYVGCSGNLTVERVSANLGIPMHGNDVNIYTCAIGSYFAGKLMRLDLSEKGASDFPFMRDYMGSDSDKLATLMLASAICALPGQGGLYFERMVAAYASQWDRMHRQTKQKVEKLSSTLHLETFTPADVVDWVHTVPQEAAFVSFPPFQPAGYVVMFERLAETFDWDEPSFVLMDQKRKYEFVESAMDREHWMFCLDYDEPEYEKWLTGVTWTTSRAVKIRIYSSDAPTRLVVPFQKVKPPKIPHLQKGQRIGDRIALVELELSAFNALRSRYLNHGIAPGAASYAYGVTVDGILVGVIAFGTSSTPVSMDNHVQGPHVYLMSDFPVGGTSYPRLSRLIVAVALSHEVKHLIERAGNKRYRSLTTTAFSKNPSSMKYRGLLRRLTARQEDDQWKVNYGQELGKWSLEEAFATWQEKNGQYDGEGED